ncbi:MAG: hypothetical protein JSR63_04235 [Proteobacteria bacterium]|nr:hypothetical protein [Pseudomonadota bacterium]
MHTSILPTVYAPKSLRKPATAALARASRRIRMNPETLFAGHAADFLINTISA